MQLVIDGQMVRALHVLQVGEQLPFVEQEPIAHGAEQLAGPGAGPIDPDARLPLEQGGCALDGVQLIGLAAVELEFHAGAFC
jgi:hypothetical protein